MVLAEAAPIKPGLSAGAGLHKKSAAEFLAEFSDKFASAGAPGTIKLCCEAASFHLGLRVQG